MSIFDALYTVFIGSLKIIFEFIFSMSYKVSGSLGLSIVSLSFVLNILLMPLYKKADELQRRENTVQTEMKPDIDFIKKTFSGNEQFMILQTYYRQNNYRPIYTLRSSVSLLLQIPFFMAAYSFLSNVQAFKNSPFGPISDLSVPDGLLFGLNLLPIAMTLINIISSIVYTKGQPVKNRVQLYLMALIFLFLLYNAPAALSFYYLLNNVFSLVKNILEKMPNKMLILSFIGLLICPFMIYLVYSGPFFLSTKLIICFTIMVFMAFCFNIFRRKQIPTVNIDFLPTNNTSFLLSTVFIAVLVGLLIPSSVISASPEEFVNKSFFVDSNSYVFHSFCLSFGLFVIWLNIFHSFMEENIKRIAEQLLWILSGLFIGEYLLFNKDLGTMSNRLHLIYIRTSQELRKY